MQGNVDWRAINRAVWDERVAIHTGPQGYDLSALRAGRGRFSTIEESELPPLDGKRILHLQCHFGADSLRLAQRGAEVVGVDFSEPAIVAARALATELNLDHRVRFVRADVYETLDAVPEPNAFDLVFVTWGALCWLPDLLGWARIVAAALRPDGALYLADAHPAARVFDDETGAPGGMPGLFAPYFTREAIISDETFDYADRQARLKHTTIVNWMHPLSAIVSSLLEAGLTLDYLHEHPAIPWRMFAMLQQDASGLYRWPDQAWLPLSFSLSASRAETRPSITAEPTRAE